jgi:streptogramin lyase
VQGIPPSGDNGSATAATFIGPTDVAVDTSGNLFIADSDRIRRVDSQTQVISTVVVLSNGFVSHVVFDKSGNLLFSGGYFTLSLAEPFFIARLNPSTGAMTTVLSNIYGIEGFAIDNAGNIFFASYSDATLRKWNASTGTISIVAGTGSYSPLGDGGPAAAAWLRPVDVAIDSSGNLFVTDFDYSFSHQRVRAIRGPIP